MRPSAFLDHEANFAVGRGDPCAFALDLVKKGYRRSALRLLAALDKPTPEARLNLAHLYLQNHDPQAVHLFQQILSDGQLSRPEKLMAKEGLAISLIRSADCATAKQILMPHFDECEAGGHFHELARARAIEIWAKLATDGTGIADSVKAMESALTNSNRRPALICQFAKEAATTLPSTDHPFLTHRLWHQITARRDENLLREWKILKSIYRRPHPMDLAALCYRTNLVTVKTRMETLSARHGWSIPNEFSLAVGPGLETDRVSLLTGEFVRAKRILKPGSAMHRLFRALVLSHFPIHAGDLFDYAFPNESFLGGRSSNRLHQLVHRLRHFLETVQPGLTIVSRKSDYALSIPSHAALLVTDVERCHRDDNAMPEREGTALMRLKAEFGTGSFKVADAACLLGLSSRSINRILKIGLEQNAVAKHGGHREVHYRFPG